MTRVSLIGCRFLAFLGIGLLLLGTLAVPEQAVLADGGGHKPKDGCSNPCPDVPPPGECCTLNCTGDPQMPQGCPESSTCRRIAGCGACFCKPVPGGFCGCAP